MISHLHDTSDARKRPMIATAEIRSWLAGIASTDNRPHEREMAAAALMQLTGSVPVTPPVDWSCACDKPGQRCTVHGWVLR